VSSSREGEKVSKVPLPTTIEDEDDPDRREYLIGRLAELRKSITDHDPAVGEAVLDRMRADGFDRQADDFLDWVAADVIAHLIVESVLRAP
jgi:hypothetical protein